MCTFFFANISGRNFVSSFGHFWAKLFFPGGGCICTQCTPLHTCLLPNAFYTPCSTLDLQSLWQSMHAWAYVKKHTKISNDLHTTMLGHVWVSPWHLLETVIVVWFLKTNFVFKLQELITFVCKNSNCLQKSKCKSLPPQQFASLLSARMPVKWAEYKIKINIYVLWHLLYIVLQ